MKAAIWMILLFLLISCRGNKNKHEFASLKEKEFYTDCEGMDYIRFPLIMPYEVKCIDLEAMNWMIDLKSNPHYYSSIVDPQRICVTNDIILVYSSDDGFITEGQDIWQWFVIIPKKKIEMGFKSESEFTKCIKQYGITEINWVDPNTAYKEFQKMECLPWIPGCLTSNSN